MHQQISGRQEKSSGALFRINYSLVLLFGVLRLSCLHMLLQCVECDQGTMEESLSQSDEGSQSLVESDGSNPPHKKQKSYNSDSDSSSKSVKKKRLRPYMKSASANELGNLVNSIGENFSPDCLDLKENLSDCIMTANLENVTESVRKSVLYRNCEIDEKTCLKPSEAMRLFQEMDAAVNRGRAKKRKWLTNTKTHTNWSKGHSDRTKSKSTGELWALSRSPSLPVDETKQCDCFEYCECFGNRKSLIRSKSLSCLNVSDLMPFSVMESLPKTKSGGNLFQSEYKPMSPASVSIRPPAHSSCKFQKDCRHLGYCDGLLQAKSTSTNQICDCSKQTVYRTSRRRSTGLDGVSPEMFVDQKQSIKKWFSDFNHEQKNLILKEILELCDMPQIHLLSIKMEPRLHHGCPPNCEDIITWLPSHLSLYIFSFLDPVSLCHCQSVCRAWKQLASEPCLWRRFCCQTMWLLSGSLQQKQMINNTLPGGRILWKQVFAERFKLRHNWLKGRCNVRTFEGHTQGISCVQFDDTRIVSGSSDKTIKVWNIRTNTPLSVQTLVGHSGTVRCLHLEGNRLVSGSSDRTIKVWDLSTQQSWSSIACKVTMIGHLHTVRCLQVDDEKVISGSYDKTLKIWNIKTGHCRRTLRGHEGEVLCVQYDETKIVSGSVDKTIKIWSFDGICLRTLTGHHDAVTCLQFNMTRIVSGSLDCSLKFWDVDSCECLKTIDWKASEGHTRVVRCLQTDTWRVVSASDDRTLKVWSLETGKRLVTLRNHTDGVTCLQFNDSIIVSGSYDKTVKLWDFSCC